MTNRVQVTIQNRRVKEVFNAFYLDTSTRREAKAQALAILHDELEEILQGFGPCRMSVSCLTMKDGARV